MTRFIALLCLSALLLCQGCWYTVRDPQFLFAAEISGLKEAGEFRAQVREFSRANGFGKHTRAGNAEHLEAEGIYIVSYAADDESFITFNNVGDKHCYVVSVFSSKGDAAAGGIARRLIAQLKKHPAFVIHDDPEGSCN